MKYKKNDIATAYHEAGHAVVALYTDYAKKVKKISIIPDPDRLGFVKYYQKRIDDYDYLTPVEEKRIQCP